jgi:hypothetical protein
LTQSADTPETLRSVIRQSRIWLASFITQVCLRKCHEANRDTGKNPRAVVGGTDRNELHHGITTAELPLFLPVSETRTANSSLSERQMVIVSNML